jgi:hypothetical protein
MDNFVEEALANRQVWDWARKPNIGLNEFAFELMKVQPGAYSRFDENRLDLAAEWASNVLDLVRYPTKLRYDVAPWVETSPKDLAVRSLCPEWIVSPASLDLWWASHCRIPPMFEFEEDNDVSKFFRKRKDQQLRAEWEKTKQQLLKEPFLGSLGLKQWRKEKDAWSVEVNNGGYRAHMRHQGAGKWLVYKIGDHESMGHGK